MRSCTPQLRWMSVAQFAVNRKTQRLMAMGEVKKNQSRVGSRGVLGVIAGWQDRFLVANWPNVEAWRKANYPGIRLTGRSSGFGWKP